MPELLAEVVSEEELRARTQQLGAEISEAYRDRRPVLVGILIGSVPFLADLVRFVETDIDVDFLALSRFGEGGRVRIALDTQVSLTGRDVILVANVVDTGLTLTTLRRMLEARSPASLATVALVDKTTRRIVDVPIEYRGFEAGDEYLLGYGFDWRGRFRNLKSIWAVLDLAALAEDPDLPARELYGDIDDRVNP
jgi:hypoxanthine phosphoribosyltransferase